MERLNHLKTQLQNLDFEHLDKSHKRFLIDNQLIDPVKTGIDVDSLQEEEVEIGIPDSDSDTDDRASEFGSGEKLNYTQNTSKYEF